VARFAGFAVLLVVVLVGAMLRAPVQGLTMGRTS
jgi:hypothetical protein